MRELLTGIIILTFIFFELFKYKIYGQTKMFKAKHPVDSKKRMIGNSAYAKAFDYVIGILFIFSFYKLLTLDASKPINIIQDVPELIYLSATLIVLLYSFIKENKGFM
ncbi:hypothetical protein ACN5ZK_05725 [Macrococcoides bohemicum]|uniref:hypothetical protein n=1 Tax=Macrococcoides bohemicum TaxID=1903056 RepID=UPI000BB53D5B|nr:hypothetical protein [Macrococcus sp. IME1552]ATD31239.1 hypothetical protein BHM04_08605 [Macrococcus sp. IME1552]